MSSNLILQVFVPGIPLPKGSGSAIFRGGKPGGFLEMADKATKTRKSGGLKRWQRDIRDAATAAVGAHREPYDGPVILSLRFLMPKPKKPRFDVPASKPDLDKLVRAVGDALSGIAYQDDSRVVWLKAAKSYASNGGPGVAITVDAV